MSSFPRLLQVRQNFPRPEPIELAATLTEEFAKLRPHLCLGAPHARLIVRTLLQSLVDRVAKIDVIAARENVERKAEYESVNGYESLVVRFTGR
jgi:hypothetical protein